MGVPKGTNPLIRKGMGTTSFVSGWRIASFILRASHRASSVTWGAIEPCL